MITRYDFTFHLILIFTISRCIPVHIVLGSGPSIKLTILMYLASPVVLNYILIMRSVDSCIVYLFFVLLFVFSFTCFYFLFYVIDNPKRRDFFFYFLDIKRNVTNI